MTENLRSRQRKGRQVSKRGGREQRKREWWVKRRSKEEDCKNRGTDETIRGQQGGGRGQRGRN